MPEIKFGILSGLGKLLTPASLKWAANFGVSTIFAMVLLIAGIYFINRLANAQDAVAQAQSSVSSVITEMRVLVSQSAAADSERQTRADGHYRDTVELRADIARRELEAARREVDAIERSRKLLEAIQALVDSARESHPKAKP